MLAIQQGCIKLWRYLKEQMDNAIRIARIGMFTDIRMIRTPSRPSSSRCWQCELFDVRQYIANAGDEHLSAAGQQTHCMLLQV